MHYNPNAACMYKTNYFAFENWIWRYISGLAIFVFNMHGSLCNWIVDGLTLGLVYPGLIACVMNG